MGKNEILNAVKQARAGSKERKFKQTFDLAINFKALDLKNPAHKIKDEIVLPHGHGKDVKIAAFADGVVAEAAKKAGIEKILDKAELIKIAGNKKELRVLVNTYDFFIAQPDYMVEIGKRLGAVLGPRNKMPQPVPPNAPLEPIKKRFEKLVKVRIANLPTVHCKVGTEEMSDDQIADNIDAVLQSVARKTPVHEDNFRSLYVKTTMGKPIQIGGIGQTAGKKIQAPKPQAEPIEPADGGEDQ